MGFFVLESFIKVDLDLKNLQEDEIAKYSAKLILHKIMQGPHDTITSYLRGKECQIYERGTSIRQNFCKETCLWCAQQSIKDDYVELKRKQYYKELPKIGWLLRDLLIPTDCDDYIPPKNNQIYDDEPNPFNPEVYSSFLGKQADDDEIQIRS